MVSALDRAAELGGHRHLAVADAEHRHAGLEDRLRRARRSGFVDRFRAARKDHAARLHLGERFGGFVEGHDLAIDPLLAHAPRDELGDLRAEIDDENLVVRHPKQVANRAGPQWRQPAVNSEGTLIFRSFRESGNPVRLQGLGPRFRGASGGRVYPLPLIASASRSPERIAPSMKDGQCIAVSVPAQRIGPTGSRTAEPNSEVAPGVRKPVKQPRVQVSVDQLDLVIVLGLERLLAEALRDLAEQQHFPRLRRHRRHLARVVRIDEAGEHAGLRHAVGLLESQSRP